MAATTTSLTIPFATKLVVDAALSSLVQTDVIGTAGVLQSIYVNNPVGAVVYIKFYDAKQVNTATDIPDLVLPLTASTSSFFDFGAGWAFTSGLSIQAVANATTTTVAPASALDIRLALS
tara:strand:- start:7138 stop:7497 length:360 start_codon:yes stop_codon:yes gene_type:complete